MLARSPGLNTNFSLPLYPASVIHKGADFFSLVSIGNYDPINISPAYTTNSIRDNWDIITFRTLSPFVV
jgi:hypothetical protein